VALGSVEKTYEIVGPNEVLLEPLKSNACLPRDVSWNVISARRYVTLFYVLGKAWV
jgi:hypothetical protein